MAEYGIDVSTSLGFDATGQNVSGPRSVLESVLHRWTTDPAQIEDYIDDDECLDISTYLSASFAEENLFELAARMESAAERDERVNKASVNLAYYAGTESLVASAQIQLQDQSKPFALVVEFSKATTAILSLG